MKAQFKEDRASDPLHEKANRMAADSIINYKTIASFGRINWFIEKYNKQLDKPTQ